jgi:protein SCO1/2
MLVVLVLAVVPGIFIPTLMCRGDTPHLDDLGSLPHFTLVDEAGHDFTDDALRGHPTIVSFLFTRCDTICPVTTSKMRHIQEETFGSPIKLVSFSVDPTYDTPERLTAYAKKFDADAERWRFVTGPVDRVKPLLEGPFMTSMEREGSDREGGVPNIAHGGYFMLVDATLRIRGAYDSNDIHRLDDLVRDARYLARIQSSK